MATAPTTTSVKAVFSRLLKGKSVKLACEGLKAELKTFKIPTAEEIMGLEQGERKEILFKLICKDFISRKFLGDFKFCVDNLRLCLDAVSSGEEMAEPMLFALFSITHTAGKHQIMSVAQAIAHSVVMTEEMFGYELGLASQEELINPGVKLMGLESTKKAFSELGMPDFAFDLESIVLVKVPIVFLHGWVCYDSKIYINVSSLGMMQGVLMAEELPDIAVDASKAQFLLILPQLCAMLQRRRSDPLVRTSETEGLTDGEKVMKQMFGSIKSAFSAVLGDVSTDEKKTKLSDCIRALVADGAEPAAVKEHYNVLAPFRDDTEGATGIILEKLSSLYVTRACALLTAANSVRAMPPMPPM